MRAHGVSTLSERVRAFEELRQEIQGRAPKGPFEFSSDLEFDDPRTAATPATARFQAAVRRDARFATAGPVYLRLFGFSQALRAAYYGGTQLIDGGVQ